VPSQRQLQDVELSVKILAIYTANRSVYGARKIWLQLQRDGVAIGLDRVERLMRELGIRGARRGGWKLCTTKADPRAALPPDLVNRDFSAIAPNVKWVSDFTYVPTDKGMVYVAFVIDLFSRMIVGWSTSIVMDTSFVLDALEMAIMNRGGVDGVIHHSDRGSQYTAIRYGERLNAAGIAASVGSKGDSYDNAVAESTIGLYKTELIGQRETWRDVTHIEMETASYVGWFNTTRLHGSADDLSPQEFEMRAAA
jgi:putative transposase